jgi:hypothetical protein
MDTERHARLNDDYDDLKWIAEQARSLLAEPSVDNPTAS